MSSEIPKQAIEIYMEQTPNPEALKFVTNILLLPQGSVNYPNKEAALYCPLAYQLFDFSGVTNIFITTNFVTVTKNAAIDWWEIQNIIREFIRGFLIAGDAVFTRNPLPDADTKPTQVKSEVLEQPIAKGPIDDKIIALLDEYVRPAVAQDGGAIDFKSFNDGVVTLTLKGSCSGCPSSTQTLKAGIERLLTQMLPEVTEVVAE
jgi:Fe-S cluster biogenesis protein NfuA